MANTLTATIGVEPASATRTVERTCVDLADVPVAAWRDLYARAIEPNAFYHPAWARAACAHGREASRAKVLLAWDPADPSRLIGLLPVVSGWQALGVPLPFLVSWQPYTRLTTPLLDRDRARDAATALVDAAAATGARALLLVDHASNGPAATALREVMAQRGLAPRMLRERERALLDATQPAEEMLHEALGPKKIKELRRQRHRLEDGGAVTFDVATTPAAVRAALEHFLTLEASGWKGTRGTALAEDDGDQTFIREATEQLAQDGCCEVVTLAVDGAPAAAGIVLRHGSRAWFFKIAYDERLAKSSPGVQLTLDLTRHLAADPAIADVDSSANAYHPMIDKIWRSRIAIATALLPLRRRGALLGPIEFLIHARERTRRDLRRAYHRLIDLWEIKP